MRTLLATLAAAGTVPPGLKLGDATLRYRLF